MTSSTQAEVPLQQGELIAGRWRVDHTLGSGAFGWVVAATSVDGNVRAALKVLRPERAESKAAVTRFVRREIEILRRVHRTGSIPQVVRAMEDEVFEHAGLLVLALELVDGPTLAQAIASDRILDLFEARRLLRDLAVGLAAIHAAEGVHRDVKPDNVRLRSTGEAVLLDLGIAKALWSTTQLTATNEAPMTPLYAAPEQLSGAETGPPADVYALGLVGYEMLTGAVPLTGRSFTEILATRLRGEAPDVRSFGRPVDDAMAELLRSCLARDPAARPTASEVAEGLASTARGASRSVAPVSGLESTLEAPGAARSDPFAATALARSPAALAMDSTLHASADPTARTSRRSWVIGGAAVLTLAAFAAYLGLRDPKLGSDRAGTATASGVARAPTSAGPVESSVPPSPSSNPQADLRVTVDPRVVRSGEPMTITVESAVTKHLLVLGIDAQGKGTMLAPGREAPAPRVDATAAFRFPPEASRARLRAALASGATESREEVVVFGFATSEARDGLVPPRARRAFATTLSAGELEALVKGAHAASAQELRVGYTVKK